MSIVKNKNKEYRVVDLRVKTHSIEILTCKTCGEVLNDGDRTYVCNKCGLASNELIIVNSNPNNEISVQHEIFSNKYPYTSIGNKKERKNSEDLNRMHKMQTKIFLSNEEILNRKAKNLIKIVFNELQINSAFLFDAIFEKYKELRKCQRFRCKKKSWQILIPVLMFCYFKIENIVINEDNLREFTCISERKFNAILLALSEKDNFGNFIFPEYAEFKFNKDRRKKYILTSINHLVFSKEFKEKFQNEQCTPKEFLKCSKVILDKFWKDYGGKDINIAGIVATKTLYYLRHRNNKVFPKLNQHQICRLLRAKYRTVSDRINNWRKSLQEKNGVVITKEEIGGVIESLIGSIF